jgi:YihY family inner membrane protein
VAVDRFDRNDGWSMSGFIAFSGLLSLFPFLIFAATLTGILVGSDRSDTIIESLFEIAPAHVAQTLAPVVEEVLNKQSGEVLTLSALFAIWVASSAVEAFRVAFDRAYAVPDPRGFFHNRALAIAMVFLGAIVAALLGVTILFMPLILRLARPAPRRRSRSRRWRWETRACERSGRASSRPPARREPPSSQTKPYPSGAKLVAVGGGTEVARRDHRRSTSSSKSDS